MKFKFGGILIVIFICAPAAIVLGQLNNDNSYILGQSLILIGTLGLGSTFVSLGIFAFANAETFTKGTIIPLLSALPPKVGAIFIGVQLMILAAIMVYQAINTIGNIIIP